MENIKKQMKKYSLIAWAFLKEKFQEFWLFLKRIWTKYHLTKVLLVFALSLSLLTSVYLTVWARRTNVSTLRSSLEQTTVVMDDQGEEAGTLYAQKGTFTSLDNISASVKNAVISTEDQRFFNHHGFDPIGIGRAAVGYVMQGHIVGGGSTITQQLAKNAYLTADQSLTRKLKELFLAIEIEKNYSKDEILEMYLNNSYFGQGVWGVEDASKRFFNKHASELNIAEGATIAGILKAPSNYNPIDNYDKAISRRNVVLSLMAQTGAISEGEKDEMIETGLTLVDGYQRTDRYHYPYYFDAVIAEAINKYKFTEQDILNGGYKIYTNLNQKQQEQMTNVFANRQLFETASDGVDAQSASISIHPRTGGVTAVVGGRGDHEFRGFNRATQMRRQPGSIIKPLAVYAPALEAGYTINDILIDEERTYGEDYTPSNHDNQFSGEIPMYQALSESKNAATVWLLNEIGVRKGYNKLKKFGIKVDEDDVHLGAIALGGMKRGTTPMEMASAYTVFANDGVQVEPHFITQIVDSTGAIVVDNTSPKQKRVLSEKVNDDMNRMLLNVFSNGNAQAAQPSGYQIAGKTGTTQTSTRTGATDQWMVGYTPDLVIASWQGFDEASEDHYLKTYTTAGIGQVLKREFETMLPYTSGTEFAAADIDQPVPDSGNEFFEKIGEGLKETSKKIWEDSEGLREQTKDTAKKVKEKLDSFIRNIR